MSFFQRLFKFRIFKFRTTLAEELDDLHTESLNLQHTLVQTRQQQQKWIKWFAIYAALIYVSLILIFYGFFLPEDYLQRTYAITIIVTIGGLLYGLHWLLRWYFRTIVQMKQDRISLFKDRKQELIEEVKNKETYAKAKVILEKYGETIPAEPRPSTNVPAADTQKGDLRQRVSVKPAPPPSGPPANIGRLETTNPPPPPPAGPNAMPGRLPRAILPPQQTFWGAILDAIVGDGPSKRYALICKSCNSHNGMALEEEFEYISYRCAYCNYYNSARKQKPVFHGDIVPTTTLNAAAQPTTTDGSVAVPSELTSTEQTDGSISDGEESSPEPSSSNVIHRSFPLPTDETNRSHSRSTSVERRSQLENENSLSEQNSS